MLAAVRDDGHWTAVGGHGGNDRGLSYLYASALSHGLWQPTSDDRRMQGRAVRRRVRGKVSRAQVETMRRLIREAQARSSAA